MQYFNTWLPLMIINVDLSSDSNIKNISENSDYEFPGGVNFNNLVFEGRFRDTYREWI